MELWWKHARSWFELTIDGCFPWQNDHDELQAGVSVLEVPEHGLHAVGPLCVFTETRLALDGHSRVSGNLPQLFCKGPGGWKEHTLDSPVAKSILVLPWGKSRRVALSGNLAVSLINCLCSHWKKNRGRQRNALYKSFTSKPNSTLIFLWEIQNIWNIRALMVFWIVCSTQLPRVSCSFFLLLRKKNNRRYQQSRRSGSNVSDNEWENLA